MGGESPEPSPGEASKGTLRSVPDPSAQPHFRLALGIQGPQSGGLQKISRELCLKKQTLPRGKQHLF